MKSALVALLAMSAFGWVATGDDAPLREAQSLAASEKWNDAEHAARQYLDAQPDSADAHALLAFILFKQTKPKESMAEYVALPGCATLQPPN